MPTEYEDLGIATIQISDLHSIIYELKLHFDTDCLICQKADICDGKHPDCGVTKDRIRILQRLGNIEIPTKKEEANANKPISSQ